MERFGHAERDIMGYVYIIGSKRFGWYKIGRSSRSTVRVSEIGVLLPFKIELIGMWQCADSISAEKSFHRANESFRINGEWFAFNGDELRDFTEVQTKFLKRIESLNSFSNIDEDIVVYSARQKQRLKMFTEEERKRKKLQAIVLKRCRPQCPTCKRSIDLNNTRTLSKLGLPSLKEQKRLEKIGKPFIIPLDKENKIEKDDAVLPRGDTRACS